MEKSIWQLPFNVLRHYWRFHRSQFWSREKLHDFQFKKLKQLIDHSYNKVPYYRELFDKHDLHPEDILRLEDMKRIPVLDKETVRRRSQSIIASDARQRGMNWDSTSGSTGKPLHFITDNSTQAAKIAALLRSFGWGGYRLGKKMLSMQSYYFADRSFKYNPFYNVIRFDSNWLSQDSIRELIVEIKIRKPQFIMGFPFDIVMLARYAREDKQTIGSVKAVITYGETLSPAKRKIIESYFKCRVFNFFSLHECAAMIAECEAGNLHAIDDFAFHEILDSEYNQVKNGIGNLYGTSYFNYAMPFIRYNIGDKISISERSVSCSCGRPYPIIEEISGKQCDFIETPDGRFLGAVMSHSIDKVKGVTCSQCIQESIDHILVMLVTDSEYNQQSLAELEKGLRKRLGEKIKLRFQLVSQLEKLASGKTPFIISRIGNKYI